MSFRPALDRGARTLRRLHGSPTLARSAVGIVAGAWLDLLFWLRREEHRERETICRLNHGRNAPRSRKPAWPGRENRNPNPKKRNEMDGWAYDGEHAIPLKQIVESAQMIRWLRQLWRRNDMPQQDADAESPVSQASDSAKPRYLNAVLKAVAPSGSNKHIGRFDHKRQEWHHDADDPIDINVVVGTVLCVQISEDPTAFRPAEIAATTTHTPSLKLIHRISEYTNRWGHLHDEIELQGTPGQYNIMLEARYPGFPTVCGNLSIHLHDSPRQKAEIW